MALTRDAAYLMLRVRDEVGVYDREALQDGYASEEGQFPPGPSILRQLNWALHDLRDTGFNACYFDLTLTANIAEYLIPKEAHDIISAFYLDSSARQFPLKKISLLELDTRWSGGSGLWRRMRQSRPNEFYTIGTRAIGFFGVPTLTGTITYLADTLVDNLALPTDIPGQIKDNANIVIGSALPEGFYELVAIGAAMRLCSVMGKHTQAARLKKEWDQGKKDLRALAQHRTLSTTRVIPLETGRSYWRGW